MKKMMMNKNLMKSLKKIILKWKKFKRKPIRMMMRIKNKRKLLWTREPIKMTIPMILQILWTIEWIMLSIQLKSKLYLIKMTWELIIEELVSMKFKLKSIISKILLNKVWQIYKLVILKNSRISPNPSLKKIK